MRCQGQNGPRRSKHFAKKVGTGFPLKKCEIQRIKAISPKLPKTASFDLEIIHYDCNQIPGFDAILTETGGEW